MLIVVTVFGKTAMPFFEQHYDEICQNDGADLRTDMTEGVAITFKATKDDVSKEEMQAVEAIMDARIKGMGYTEAKISHDQFVFGRITVEIPGITDTEDVKVLLCSPGRLSFRNSTGAEVLNGDDVDKAESRYGKTSENGNSGNYIELTLKKDSVSKWYEATSDNIGKPIYICLDYDESLNLEQQDSKIIAAPNVNSAIDSETCIITGDFDRREAKLLASQINSGVLPFELVVESENIISLCD